MKNTIILLGLVILLPFLSSAQADKHQLKVSDEIAKYLDPAYPKLINTGNKNEDHAKWSQAMDKYAIEHPSYPKYVSTGSTADDENTFQLAIEFWFMRNPYYPQYIDTGKPTDDYANWVKSKEEWCNRYPDVCKIVDSYQH
jgi:hypothetical protein